MPLGDFDKDIELAKLQAKISNKQTDTYTLVGINFGLTAAFLTLAVTVSSVKIPFLSTYNAIVFSLLLAISAIGFLVVATYSLRKWYRFQSVVRDDFNKISRREKIEF